MCTVCCVPGDCKVPYTPRWGASPQQPRGSRRQTWYGGWRASAHRLSLSKRWSPQATGRASRALCALVMPRSSRARTMLPRRAQASSTYAAAPRRSHCGGCRGWRLWRRRRRCWSRWPQRWTSGRRLAARGTPAPRCAWAALRRTGHPASLGARLRGATVLRPCCRPVHAWLAFTRTRGSCVAFKMCCNHVVGSVSAHPHSLELRRAAGAYMWSRRCAVHHHDPCQLSRRCPNLEHSLRSGQPARTQAQLQRRRSCQCQCQSASL